MKKLFTLLVVCIITTQVFAQTNLNFESFYIPVVTDPPGWETDNQFTAFPPNISTLAVDTLAGEGDQSIQLLTTYPLPFPFPSGDTTVGRIEQTFKVTSIPKSLSFLFKSEPAANDAGIVVATTFHWQGSTKNC